LPSVEHWAVVVELVQMPPGAVHGSAELHSHAEAPAVVVHVWWTPQVLVVTHCVQPFDCVSHVCTVLVDEHWVATPPSVGFVQPFVQHEAAPASP
jgi:hypothetical protein